jgi:hypothetical protein
MSVDAAKYGSPARCGTLLKCHRTRSGESMLSRQTRQPSPGASICTRPPKMRHLAVLWRDYHAHIDARYEILINKLINEKTTLMVVRTAKYKIDVREQLADISLEYVAFDYFDCGIFDDLPDHPRRQRHLWLSDI